MVLFFSKENMRLECIKKEVQVYVMQHDQKVQHVRSADENISMQKGQMVEIRWEYQLLWNKFQARE